MESMSLRLLLGLLAAMLLLAGVARAGQSEEITGEMPADCALAEATINKRLDPVFGRAAAPTNLRLGDVIALLQRARSLCLDDQAERGMLIYFRLSDVVGAALTAELDSERRRR